MLWIIGSILDIALWILFLIVIARFIVDWIRFLAPRWRPRGLVAAALEILYSLTDPPMNAIRRVVPPVRLGQTMIDFSPMILIVAIYVLRLIVAVVFFR